MTTLKGSDNAFPSILFEEHVDPATPPAGHWRLFMDTDNIFKLIDDAGTVTNVGGTGLTDPMTTRGDMIVRNASNVTARLAIGSTGKVLSSDGTDISWQTPSAGAMATDALWDAAGDLAVGTGANTGAKLTIGSTGQVLTVAAGTASWATPAAGTFVGCRAYNNANIALNTNSATVLTFNSERFDTNAIHDTSTNTSRLTIPTALGGKWHVGGTVHMSLSPSPGSHIYIRLNGSTILAVQNVDDNGSTSISSLSTIYDFAVADYVELIAVAVASSKNALASANFSPEFWAYRLG